MYGFLHLQPEYVLLSGQSPGGELASRLLGL